MKQTYLMTDEDGAEYDIPQEHLESFRQTFPKASATTSYRTENGEEYDIPQGHDEAFRQTFANAQPMRRYSFADGTTRSFTAPELAKFLGTEYRTDERFARDRDEDAAATGKAMAAWTAQRDAAQAAVPPELQPRGALHGAAQGALAGAKFALGNIAAALPEAAASIAEAGGNALEAGSAPGSLGDAFGSWLRNSGRGLKRWLGENVKGDMYDENGVRVMSGLEADLGYMDDLAKVGEIAGDAAGMAVKFAPAAVAGPGYIEAILASDGINAYRDTYDSARERGWGAAEANVAGATAGLINYFGGKMLMKSGEIAGDWVKGVLGRFLASGGVASGAMAAQAAGNRGVQNVLEGRPLTEGMGRDAADAAVEGGMFHVMNAAAHGAKGAVAARKETAAMMDMRKSNLLAVAEAEGGGEFLDRVMRSNGMEAAIEARKSGMDVSRKMGKAADLPDNMNAEERNAVVDAIVRNRAAQPQQQQPPEAQPAPAAAPELPAHGNRLRRQQPNFRHRGQGEEPIPAEEPVQTEQQTTEPIQEKTNETRNVPVETQPQPSAQDAGRDGQQPPPQAEPRPVEAQPQGSEVPAAGQIEAQPETQPASNRLRRADGTDPLAEQRGQGAAPERADGFRLESSTPQQIAAEEARRREQAEIKRRQEAPLKGSGAVNVQPEMDLGQTGQQDLFSPIAEKPKTAPVAAPKKTGATTPPKGAESAEGGKSASAGTSAASAFKRGDRVFLKGAADGQRVTFLKANVDGTADVQVRTPGANRYMPEKVETRTVPIGDVSGGGMKDTLTDAERSAYRRGVAEQQRDSMRDDPILQRIDAAYRTAETDAERNALKAQFVDRARQLQSAAGLDTSEARASRGNAQDVPAKWTDAARKPLERAAHALRNSVTVGGKRLKVSFADRPAEAVSTRESAAMAGTGRLLDNGRGVAALANDIRSTAATDFDALPRMPQTVDAAFAAWRGSPTPKMRRQLAKAIFGTLSQKTVKMRDGRDLAITENGIDNVLSHMGTNEGVAQGRVAFVRGIMDFAKNAVPVYSERKGLTRYTTYAALAKYGNANHIGSITALVGTDGRLGLHDINAIQENINPTGSNRTIAPSEGRSLVRNSNGVNTRIILQRVLLGQDATAEDFANWLAGQASNTRKSIGGVFTGTAADYANRSRQGGVDDGPSVKKIGTGEGSQVYGWGLYGSNVRGVAEGYAKADLSRKDAQSVLINDKDAKFASAVEMRVARAFERAYGNVKGTLENLRNGYYDAKIKSESGHDPNKKAEAAKDAEFWKQAIEDFEANPEKYRLKEGNIYEQTFFTNRAPGDESHLLKWYGNVSDPRNNFAEQEKWIRAQAKKEDVKLPRDLGGWGEDVYKTLADVLGSPQAASEFLYRAGIDGIKYPVDSYGGKTVKDGDKAGWNYVAFSDENIRVDHKWTDGELRYMRNADGVTVGEYDAAKGEIRLYPGATVADVVHEFTHPLMDYARAEADAGRGEFMGKIKQIIDAERATWEKPVRDAYAGKGEGEILEEIFAHAIGKKGERLFGKSTNTLEGRRWYNRLWDAVKGVWQDFATKMGWNKADLRGLDGMSPEDAAQKILSEMAKGRSFGDAATALTGEVKFGKVRAMDHKRLADVMRGLVADRLKHPRFTKEEVAASGGTKHERLWNYILSLESTDVHAGGAKAGASRDGGDASQGGDWLERFRRMVTRYGSDPRGLNAPSGIMDEKERIFEKWTRNFSDRFAPIKSLQESARKNALPGADVPDPYYEKRVQPGRNEADRRAIDMIADEYRRFLRDSKGKVTHEDMSRYVKARDALYRNPDMQKRLGVVNGAGISDAKAREWLDGFQADGKTPTLEKGYAIIQKLKSDFGLQRLVDGGMLDQETAKMLEDRNPDYAPQRTDWSDENGGFDRNSTRSMESPALKKALGRSSEADDPITFLFMQAKDNAARTNENRTRQEMAKLVRMFPEIGKVRTQNKTKAHDYKTGGDAYVDDPMDREDKNLLLVSFRENGRKMYIEFADTERGRMVAEAMRDEGVVRSPEQFAAFTRAWASTATQLSGTFTGRNFLKDTIEVALNSAADTGLKGGAGFLKNQMADMPGVVSTIREYLKKGTFGGKFGRELEMFVKEGGEIGGIGREGYQDVNADLSRQQKSFAGKFALGGAKEKASLVSEAVFGRIKGANEVVEFLSRFNNFRNRLARAGANPSRQAVKDAVLASREDSTDFNMYGRQRWLNDVYMFSNSILGGTLRSAKLLAKNPKRGAALAGSLLAYGFVEAMADALFNDDDDREAARTGTGGGKDLSERERSQTLFFRFGGKYFRLPMHAGPFSALKYTGGNIARAMLGKISWGDAAAYTAKEWATLGTHLGGAGEVDFANGPKGVVESLTPSVIRPIVELASNQDFAGKRIYRPEGFDTTKPKSESAFQSTGAGYVAFARLLNRIGGGNEHRRGWEWLDNPPEAYKHIVEAVGKNMWRDVSGAADLVEKGVKSAATGRNEFDRNDIPGLRDVTRNVPDNTHRYYDALEKYKADKAELKGTQDVARARELRRGKPYLFAGKSLLDGQINQVKELMHLERGEIKYGKEWVKPKTPVSEERKKRYHDKKLQMQARILKTLGG